jgi:hypothetical protein
MAFHVYPNAPSQRSFQVCRQRMDESPFTPRFGNSRLRSGITASVDIENLGKVA